MKTQDNSRRLFLQKFLSTGLAVFAGGALLASCNSETKEQAKQVQDTTSKAASGSTSTDEFICGDYSKVSKEELAKRKKLGYEENSSDPERECKKCNLFIPKGEEKTCGGCILFKGPVNKEGSCTYWVEQVS
jgi:hypothetical protein